MQEFEQQGVAATLEMQRAARKVAQDNLRLRALLARHGVSNELIESFLRSPDDLSTPEAKAPSPQRRSSGLEHQATEKDGVAFASHTQSPHQTQSRYGGSERPRLLAPHSPEGTEIYGAQALYSSRPSTCTAQTKVSSHEMTAQCSDTPSHREANDGTFSYPIAEPSECPSSLDCFCAPPPVGEYRPPTSSGLKISCEAAAAVIAEMRGDGDRDSIRASLGCRGQESCTVKNSTVFQIMDEG